MFLFMRIHLRSIYFFIYAFISLYSIYFFIYLFIYGNGAMIVRAAFGRHREVCAKRIPYIGERASELASTCE